jgi:hypothetical protein
LWLTVSAEKCLVFCQFAGVCREMFGFLSVCGCRWKNKAVVPGKERELGALAGLAGAGGRNELWCPEKRGKREYLSVWRV